MAAPPVSSRIIDYEALVRKADPKTDREDPPVVYRFGNDVEKKDPPDPFYVP